MRRWSGVFGVQMDGPVERLEPAVARSLSMSAVGPTPAFPAGVVRAVSFDWDDEGHVSYEADVSRLASLDTLAPSPDRLLGLLASLAGALRGLHALGQVHGDLGLDAVRVDQDGSLVVLQPARRLQAGALLAARLRSGASPSAVAFAAPEVVTGFEATPASDVFAVAALAHRLLMGQPPLGQIDFRDPRGTQSPLAVLIERSLAAAPGARPSIEQLEAAFAEAAAAAKAFADAAAAQRPYRDGAAPAGPSAGPMPGAVPGAARSPAEASARRADASNMSAILALILAVGGLFVFTGAVWLVAVNWDALGQAGRFVLLLLVTTGILAGASVTERRGYARSGAALMILGAELLWADGAYVLDLTGHLDEAGSWAVLSLMMTAIAFGLGWVRRSGAFGGLAAAHFAVFAVTFGEAIKRDTKTGPALYWLALAIVYAAIALAGHRGRGAVLGVPFAIGACLAGWISAVAGLALLDDDGMLAFAVAWPYLVVATSAGIAGAVPGGYRIAAWVACSGIVALAPTTTALVQSDHFGLLLLAIAVGLALVTAAFRVARIARDMTSQLGAVLLGIVNATLASTILFLVHSGDLDGLPMLRGPYGHHMVTMVAVAALLVGSSYAFGRAAVKKEVYRVVELAGLAQFFGAFTIASLLRYDDWFYPAVCLTVGAAVLGLGVATRRATLVVLASCALLANLFIQYFAKLRDKLPVSALVIGFGLALLASGVLYERRLRRLLPRLKAWD